MINGGRLSSKSCRLAVRQLEKAKLSRRPHDYARGAFVIVFDDESRENEGDLMVADEHTDHIAMAYLLDHTAGVVCAAVPFGRCAELRLPQMVSANSGLHATPGRSGRCPGAITAGGGGRCSRLLAARAQPRADRARSGHDAMGRRPEAAKWGRSYCLGPGTSGMQFICVNAASGDRRAGSAMTVPDRWVPWLVERMRHAASGSNVLR